METNENLVKSWVNIQQEYETGGKSSDELKKEAAERMDFAGIRGIKKHFKEPLDFDDLSTQGRVPLANDEGEKKEEKNNKTKTDILKRAGKINVEKRAEEDHDYDGDPFIHNPYLPTCPILLDAVATCQILPCNHRISKLALLRHIDDKNFWCPLCGASSGPWEEVRCLTVKKTEKDMKKIIEEATDGFPEGSDLKKLFSMIYQFITSPELLESEGDLLMNIAACILENTISNNTEINLSADNNTQGETKETHSTSSMVPHVPPIPDHVLKISIGNNKQVLKNIINCFKKVIMEHFVENQFPVQAKEFEWLPKSLRDMFEESKILGEQQMDLQEAIVPGDWRKEPMGWLLLNSIDICDNAEREVDGLDIVGGQILLRQGDVDIIPGFFDRLRHDIYASVGHGISWIQALRNADRMDKAYIGLAGALISGIAYLAASPSMIRNMMTRYAGTLRFSKAEAALPGASGRRARKQRGRAGANRLLSHIDRIIKNCGLTKEQQEICSGIQTSRQLGKCMLAINDDSARGLRTECAMQESKDAHAELRAGDKVRLARIGTAVLMAMYLVYNKNYITDSFYRVNREARELQRLERELNVGHVEEDDSLVIDSQGQMKIFNERGELRRGGKKKHYHKKTRKSKKRKTKRKPKYKKRKTKIKRKSRRK